MPMYMVLLNTGQHYPMLAAGRLLKEQPHERPHKKLDEQPG